MTQQARQPDQLSGPSTAGPGDAAPEARAAGVWPAMKRWFTPRPPKRTYIRPAVFKTPYYY